MPPGKRVLVVSDVHGNLPFLMGVLEKANFSKDDILILLGDLLERSESSLDTLRYVMALSQTHRVHTLLGKASSSSSRSSRGTPPWTNGQPHHLH